MKQLQLNFLFLRPNRPIKFVNEMFLFIFKDYVFDHESLWHRCVVGHPYLMHGASLVIARVVKADYGWTSGHLDVLTITNSLLLNTLVYTRVAITSV